MDGIWRCFFFGVGVVGGVEGVDVQQKLVDFGLVEPEILDDHGKNHGEIYNHLPTKHGG